MGFLRDLFNELNPFHVDHYECPSCGGIGRCVCDAPDAEPRDDSVVETQESYDSSDDDNRGSPCGSGGFR